eukprot:scaffold47886_cov37-Tisochrysis_lutea.AAC.3
MASTLGSLLSIEIPLVRYGRAITPPSTCHCALAHTPQGVPERTQCSVKSSWSVHGARREGRGCQQHQRQSRPRRAFDTRAFRGADSNFWPPNAHIQIKYTELRPWKWRRLTHAHARRAQPTKRKARHTDKK